MKKKGFTLIELLVVIAIIGLLTTMSVLALQSSRARARDAKRLGDVKQMQTALDLYKHDANSYPATASITPGAVLSYNGVVYMAIIPAPPLPDDVLVQLPILILCRPLLVIKHHTHLNIV